MAIKKAFISRNAGLVMFLRSGFKAIATRFTVRKCVGIAVIVIGCVAGWPAVAVLGILAVRWDAPSLLIVGGPLLIVAAHLLFTYGVYLAGGNHIKTFFKWTIKALFGKRKDF